MNCVYLIETGLGPNRHDLALVQLNSWRHFLQGGVQAFVLLALLKCLFVCLALFVFMFHIVLIDNRIVIVYVVDQDSIKSCCIAPQK